MAVHIIVTVKAKTNIFVTITCFSKLTYFMVKLASIIGHCMVSP